MKKKHLVTNVLIGLILGFSTQGCKETENPPPPTNEEELITTLKVELKDTLTGEQYSFYFRDSDGEGGNPPEQWDTIKLRSNSFYQCSIKFLNESNKNAIVNITDEIEKEKKDHVICLIPSVVNIQINRTDSDGTFPVGLSSTWKTGAPGEGHVTITLKHQEGIKNGTCDLGETDVEVKFAAKIK